MRWLMLFCVLFVAATPYHVVHIQLENDQIQLLGVEPVDRPVEYYPDGSWIVEVQDSEGRVVEQNTFTPELLLPDGSTMLMNQVSVVVGTPAVRDVLVVYDDQGQAVIRYDFVASCGDGICGETEINFCEEDCESVSDFVEPTVLEDVEEERSGFTYLLIVLGGLLLVLVLVLVFRLTSHPRHLE